MPRARSSVEEWWFAAILNAKPNGLSGLELPRGLRRPIYGDISGDVDHRREALQRHRGDRLEDLLVVPAGLAGFLVEVHRGAAVLDQCLEVAQQRRLARVLGVELARRRYLVERQPGCPGRARVDGGGRLGVVGLGG